MYRRVAYLALGAAGILVILAGCTNSFIGERRAAWRNSEERACMTRRHVRTNRYFQSFHTQSLPC